MLDGQRSEILKQKLRALVLRQSESWLQLGKRQTWITIVDMKLAKRNI